MMNHRNYGNPRNSRIPRMSQSLGIARKSNLWPAASDRPAEPHRRQTRRGVASILAMMFLVIFGSLAAAMAVVAQGNLRTAASGLRVSRAMSAAETGLIFAKNRLAQESSRFVIEKGVVDTNYAFDLWMGTYSAADGVVTVLPPTGYTVTTPPSGIADAVRDAHLADTGTLTGVVTGDSAWPAIDSITGTLRVKAIPVTNQGANGPYFILKYESLPDQPFIRVTSQGVDSDITRTIQMDFRIGKKIEFAVLSPNRIMIGKNVRVEGPLGSRYGTAAGELDGDNADPLVLRSDFYFLDSTLDALLDTFFTQVTAFDVDGDNRLRPGHPVESQGLSNPALADYNGDEYVDDFDLFLAHFDTNGDGVVVYDTALAIAAGLASTTEEFTLDLQLARLIDEYLPDRDGDGVFTLNSIFPPGTESDRSLGYRDGALDGFDFYAKVHGPLAFAVSRSAWETAAGESYHEVVQGVIGTKIDEAPVRFDVTNEEMLEITTDLFVGAHNYYSNTAVANFGHDVLTDPQGLAFTGQVAQAMASNPGATYTPPPAVGERREAVPFGATGAYDYYARPVYTNMTFQNVRIPKGNNGLFVNCTFRGVTYIETEPDCIHMNWNYAGSVEEVDLGNGQWDYPLHFPGFDAELAGVPVPDTRILSNNIRFESCTIIGSISGDTPAEYTHWRNKLQFTGDTKFYIDETDPDLLADPDVGTILDAIHFLGAPAIAELKKSSILMPGWSIDVGNFTNALGTKVKLKGTIIAGILDIRGTADIHGTLLMTYRPVNPGTNLPNPLAGPLAYGGQTEAFNTTIGYFDPTSGGMEGGLTLAEIQAQGFGEITLRYNPDALLPDGVPWPVFVEPESTSYVEGGSL